MTTDVMNGAPPAGIPSEQGNPAAAQPNAATANPQTGSEEGGTEGQAAPKTFTQQELDDIIKREKAKTERKTESRVLRTLERLQPQRIPQQPQGPQGDQPGDGRPLRSQFQSEDAWLDARDAWRDRQREMQALASKTDGFYKAAEKLPGFDRDAFEERLTPAIAHAIAESDDAPRLMHHLSANPEEMERIAQLSPTRQMKELGKLEDRLAAAPKTPKTSRAPDPIGDPTARGSTTTVPTDPNRMNHEQYREWRKKQGARWAQ